MSENKSVNQKCLENVLCHLTKLIVLTEPGETDELKKLVKMSTSVSAQLLGVCRGNNCNEINEYDDGNTEEYSDDYEMTSDEIQSYVDSKNGMLTKNEISNLIKNPQIDHLQYDHKDEKWKMWNNSGRYFEFCEKD